MSLSIRDVPTPANNLILTHPFRERVVTKHVAAILRRVIVHLTQEHNEQVPIPVLGAARALGVAPRRLKGHVVWAVELLELACEAGGSVGRGELAALGRGVWEGQAREEGQQRRQQREEAVQGAPGRAEQRPQRQLGDGRGDGGSCRRVSCGKGNGGLPTRVPFRVRASSSTASSGLADVIVVGIEDRRSKNPHSCHGQHTVRLVYCRE